jgi:ATP-dependent Clp protease adapter protein ClpS
LEAAQLQGANIMSPEHSGPSGKRFCVFINEIAQQLVWADPFEGRYSKTVTLSDGTMRTVELIPVERNSEQMVEFKDGGHHSYMGLTPVRTSTTINGNLMVQVVDVSDLEAAREESRRHQSAQSPVLPPGTSLLSLPEFLPPGFVQGIEILNDNATKMHFVVRVLIDHLGLSAADANSAMLAIHAKGGALLPTDSVADAERIAAQITAEAAKGGYPLACRAVRIGGG